MERILARIVRIDHITPIYAGEEPAERIEQVFIKGWRVIVERGKFRQNELVVFLEEDSILPEAATWVKIHASFMERYKWRVKLMKLNNMKTARPSTSAVLTLIPTISQGLVLPLEAYFMATGQNLPPNEGEDVTNAMQLSKHEDPVPTGAGETAGTYPKFIPKTDEVRVQSYPMLLEELSELRAVATLKLDGSSVTVWFDDDGTAHVASRNHERKDGDNLYWNAVREYLGRMMTYGSAYAWQGEVYGEGIQGNPMNMRGKHFAIHAVYNRLTELYTNHDNEIDLCFSVGVPHVPVVKEWDRFDATLEDLESIARGLYNDTTNPREGIVVRSRTNWYSPTLDGCLSFKYINPDFLIKKG